MNTKTIKISEFDSKKHKVVLDRYGKGFAAHKVAHIRLSEKNSRLGKYLVTIDFGVGQQPISWDQNDDLISVVEEEISITNTKISFTRNFKAAVFEEEADHTIKTFFRCTKEALKNIQHCWVVKYQGELIAASKQEAKALGYTDCDESLIAIDDEHDEIPGFRWAVTSR